jgi:predicted nuclease of predicted toxin-antitoxin system
MAMVRFQADADLKQSIVSGVLRRQPVIDFKSANLADLEGKTDQQVLAIASQSGRVLVTHDRKTMPAEFGKFIESKASSGVVILSQRLAINEAIETLILIWEASTVEEWVNQIMSIPF